MARRDGGIETLHVVLVLEGEILELTAQVGLVGYQLQTTDHLHMVVVALPVAGHRLAESVPGPCGSTTGEQAA